MNSKNEFDDTYFWQLILFEFIPFLGVVSQIRMSAGPAELGVHLHPLFFCEKDPKITLKSLLAWPQYIVHPLILVPRVGPVKLSLEVQQNWWLGFFYQ